MNIGITLDEKYIDEVGINNYLDKYIKMVNSIELTLHKELFTKDTQNNIAKYAKDNSLDITYHVPDFISPHYDLTRFKENTLNTKDTYIKLLNSIEEIQGILNTSSLAAIHGGSIIYDKMKSYNSTLSFFDWILNYMAKKNYNLTLGLEILPEWQDNVCTSREDALNIVQEFSTTTLGICLDIAHDYYNNAFKYVSLDRNLLNYINYVHIHGIKKTTPVLDHIGLRGSDLVYIDYIKALQASSYSGILNLELLSKHCDDYSSTLDKSLLDIHDTMSSITR